VTELIGAYTPKDVILRVAEGSLVVCMRSFGFAQDDKLRAEAVRVKSNKSA
jgi:hypothetical protein